MPVLFFTARLGCISAPAPDRRLFVWIIVCYGVNNFCGSCGVVRESTDY